MTQDVSQGSSLIRSEARKRERQISPEKRWELIRQAIAWTDAQQPLSRATPIACKANEAKHRAPADHLKSRSTAIRKS